MCDRRPFLLAALLLVAACSAVRAQEAARWRDSARSLALQIRALRDSLLEGDSTVREVARRGDVAIGASAPLRGIAREALHQFLEASERWFGDARPAPAGFRILLRDISAFEGNRFRPDAIQTLILSGLPDSSGAARIERNVARSTLAASLVDLYGELMFASAGPELVKWLELIPPLSMPEQERRYLAMYVLATGTGRAQRGCAAGVLTDCASALRLRQPARPEPGGAYALMAREDLLLTALELGGPGAWTRLAQARGPIEGRLAAAAGMPADSLLARWRSGLLALRPLEKRITLAQVGSAMAWTALLLLGCVGAARWI